MMRKAVLHQVNSLYLPLNSKYSKAKTGITKPSARLKMETIMARHKISTSLELAPSSAHRSALAQMTSCIKSTSTVSIPDAVHNQINGHVAKRKIARDVTSGEKDLQIHLRKTKYAPKTHM